MENTTFCKCRRPSQKTGSPITPCTDICFRALVVLIANQFTIELQGDAEPIRKVPHKAPLALKDKFSAEIQSMTQQDILSEVTQSMETPEWLNSFIIVKKTSGNLPVCLDPTDLNKHII